MITPIDKARGEGNCAAVTGGGEEARSQGAAVGFRWTIAWAACGVMSVGGWATSAWRRNQSCSTSSISGSVAGFGCASGNAGVRYARVAGS